MSALADEERLAALAETQLLDTPSVPALDSYVRIAKAALEVPISLVSLVDDRRQFFSSQLGLPASVASARETPLSHSFCKYVVLDERPLIVSDARIDQRVAGNGAIVDLDVIAYAGMPIRSTDGHVLGSFSAIAHEPRVWSERDITVLTELATAVSTEIELQRRATRAEQAEKQLVAAIGSLESLQIQSVQATHDLRTPLQVIAVGLQSLQIQQLTDPRPEVSRLLGMLKRNTDHAIRLLGALHDLGNLASSEDVVDLAQLTKEVCADLQLRTPTLQINVESPETLPVRGNPRDLRRCIENLVTNAQRFAASVIAVRMRDVDGVVEVLIDDDGPGLPSNEAYQRSWSMGTRFHEAQGKSGSGIGLASVRSTIEWSGGRVMAGPSQLGGAVFGFTLPLIATSAH